MVTEQMTDRLEIKNLSVTFNGTGQSVSVVDNVSLSVKKGEVVALVGESGVGKSVTAMSIAGLIQGSSNTMVKGRIFFNGEDLAKKRGEERFRSQKIAMIFQAPVHSLNPVFSVGAQISEVFEIQEGINRRQAWKKSIEMLERVHIPSAEEVAKRYPHQLSGGMCQRIMIAMALAKNHELLIADEPTTALDVTIQAQILQILYNLQQETDISILFITHDLGIVAQFCHSVAIMYGGQIIETGTVVDIFSHPLHPYTRGLLDSIPVIGSTHRLRPVNQGSASEVALPCCRFQERCPENNDCVNKQRPALRETRPNHFVRCHNAQAGGIHG